MKNIKQIKINQNKDDSHCISLWEVPIDHSFTSLVLPVNQETQNKQSLKKMRKSVLASKEHIR